MDYFDNILSKNIFAEKELCKLAPDYSSTSILMRMQARRAMVKDTHTHGVNKTHNGSTWQRKTIKRVKDDYKMIQEIAKIKTNLHSTNLKNRIMLKNAIKHIDSSSSTKKCVDKDAYSKLKDETGPLLFHIFDEKTELVINNDTELKEKIKVEKVVSIKEEAKFEKLENTDEHNKEDNNVFRVDCTLQDIISSESNEYETEDDSFELEQQEDFGLAASKFENQADNLNNLLTMMAISSNTDGKTGQSEDLDGLVPHKDNKCCGEPKEKNQMKRGDKSEHVKDITEIINVTPIRIQVSDKQTLLIKKCVEKWKDHVAKQKDYMYKQRQETLNNFFDKLAKKKMAASQSSDSGNKAIIHAKDGMYQHRYKVQKYIIALQKAKLEEQNRIIEELRYNKIVEASKQSMDELKEEVRKTYYEVDRQLKPKLKCMTNDLKIEVEEPSLILHCLKVPQFLQRMEKRAREREEKHAVIRERRKQMEEERLRLKQQAELAKAEMDKEEKMRIIKELREKRKREKIENIRKKQHAERMRALNVMADLHYERYLKMKYGITPLKTLLDIKRDNIEKARAHYKFQLTKNVFLNWMWHTEDMWFERNFKAEDFYRKKVLRRAFDSMKQNTSEVVLKRQVAEDYYDLYVVQLAFRKFREGINVIRKEHNDKWEKAVRYYNSDLLFKTFTSWRTLPVLNAIKREQEAKKQRWRQKVLQVVPDYTPPDD